MAITLLRHTRPNIDLGICYGRTDIDVSESFANDAKIAVSKLSPPDKIISSPLQRCQKLAHFVAAALDLSCTIDQRLEEMDFGVWEGRFWNQIPSSELDAWSDDFMHAKPHMGESVSGLNARVELIIEEYRFSTDSILMVTHAGVIKSARFLAHNNKADFDWGESIEFGDNLELLL